MIRSFRHKGLQAFFAGGARQRINAKQADRILRLLDRLDAANRAEDMALPGFDFHELKGDRKGTFAVSVSGNWRITFQFSEGDASGVNLEDYH